MVGHSKWSKVKRIEGPLDVKRGAAFSRPGKEITAAARPGGGDLSGNPRLRPAVETARTINRPRENIERAIEKGTGELAETHHEEVLYDGHTPGGAALVIKAATDNKNRTAADLRFIFSKNHNRLAASGSALYLCHQKGQASFSRLLTDEGRLLAATLDGGAEEVAAGDTHDVVTMPPDQLHATAETPGRCGVAFDLKKHIDLPDSIVSVTDEDTVAQVLKLHEALESGGDTPHVYPNFGSPEDLLARLAA